ncbi:acyltransferase [Aminobacter sp. P9b]|uniref:acyltransferase family protein n=1 Tax=Aminobacter sp. P9b TaxID=3133697 RepID=UPI003252B4A4
MAERRDRLDFLDDGRGLAVLYVVIFHTVFVPAIQYPRAAKVFLEFGGSGVILFFVISAFSLSYTMPRHFSHDRPMLSYAVARLFRILPLYYFMLPLTIWRDYVWRDMTFDWGKILATIFIVFNFNPQWVTGIVWASWTIGVELPFYLIFPLLYFRLRTTWQKITFAILAAWAVYAFDQYVTPLISDPTLARRYSHYNLLHHFPVFVIGMIAFDVYQYVKDRKIDPSVGWLISCLGLSLVWVMALNKYANTSFEMDHLTAIGYATLLIGLSISPIPLFSNVVTRFYAKICYSMYLWHPFVIFALFPAYRAIYALPISLWFKLGASIAMTIPIVTVVAWCSFKWIEIPGQNLGRMFLKWVSERRQAIRSPAE